ncbi:MAG: hypothetical protein ABH884_00755 [Candidatus Komeilibacteria bacterium]
MNSPKLKFSFDPKVEHQIAWNFYNDQTFGGVNFWERGALQYHPDLISLEKVKNKKSFLADYIFSLYQKHNSEFNSQKKEIVNLYNEKERMFFSEMEKIFKDHLWPRGKYVAYLSIFDFCPRFLDNKTFFIFMYDHDNEILFTIFHEMLHFIFYDYCLVKYPSMFKNQDTEKGPLWEIAELFNAVIQQTSDFAKLHQPLDSIGYPELKQKFNTAKKIWDGNIDNWITKFAIDYIKDYN